jgi:hypothetical protein
MAEQKVPKVQPAYLRQIVGGLKAAIHDHGPITADMVTSAAKRVSGAIENHRISVRRVDGIGKRHELQQGTDYRVIGAYVLVPVITPELLERVSKISDDLDSLELRMQEACLELGAAMSVLRDANHPEGWLEIVEAK